MNDDAPAASVQRRASPWSGLLFAGATVLMAVPVFFTIDTLLMWEVTLGVTEYGHRLAVVPFVLALLCWRRGQGIASLVAFIAALALMVPLAQAMMLARSLPQQIDAAFAITQPSQKQPLDFHDLWLGREPEPVESKRLVYASGDGEGRGLFFYASQKQQPAPCLVVIHSGGWDSGSAEEFPAWNHYWAREGYAVAAIEYRLAPKSRWPAQRYDVAAALAFLKAQAASLGVDAQRFVLIGRSAGGQIATASAYALNEATIRGCISLYAPADMPFAWGLADRKDVLNSPRLMRQYLGGGADEQSENYLSASATLIAKSGDPPTLMVHGLRDTLVWYRQSERLATRLESVGVPHFYLSLPWATHALDYPFNGPGAQLTRYAVDRFLEKVTR